MKKNFLERFVESKQRVTIYVIIKLGISAFIFYLFFSEADLIKRIIFLAGGFIILMSMVPIVTLYTVSQKQKKNQAASEGNQVK